MSKTAFRDWFPFWSATTLFWVYVIVGDSTRAAVFLAAQLIILSLPKPPTD